MTMSECSEIIMAWARIQAISSMTIGVVEKIAAGAAVLDRRGGAEEAGGAGAPPGLLVARAARVPLRHLRLDLLLREAAELVAKLFVLFGENTTSHSAAPWEDDLRIRTGRGW